MNKEFILPEDVRVSDLKNVERRILSFPKHRIQVIEGHKVIVYDIESTDPINVSTYSLDGKNLMYKVIAMACLKESATDGLCSMVDEAKVLKHFDRFGLPEPDRRLSDQGVKGYDYERFCCTVIILAACVQLLTACAREDRRAIMTMRGILFEADNLQQGKQSTWTRDMHVQYLENQFMQTSDLIGDSISSIADIINRFIKDIVLYYNAATGEIRPQAQNDYALWFYQLASLLNHLEKDRSRERHQEKFCVHCGTLFWAHGNQTHCPGCNRRTIHSRTPEAKEKRKQREISKREQVK